MQTSTVTSVYLSVVFLCATAFEQPTSPATQTFQVRGTITDQSGAVIPGAKIVFQNKLFDKTLTTNERGTYEIDLPFGTYTMATQVAGFKPYHRPLFSVMSTETIVFDVTLPVQPTCDLTVVSTDGGTATREDLEAAEREFCLREDSYPVPSSSGVPFQVWIRYAKHSVTGNTHLYTGKKTPYDDPVVVAYNLFSLRADEVTYDAKTQTIRAVGNVATGDESGMNRGIDAANIKFENGRAITIK